MNKHKYCRWLCLAVGIFTAISFFFNTGSAAAQVREETVLKVAFPELKGISETDQYGNHSGLVVDYLNEIAKYTGWKYEYIPADNDKMVDNFLEGQYDLMGGTLYSPGFEEFFAYPHYNMGRSRAVLYCRRGDDRLLGYDLTSLNGKTIGVFDRATDKIQYLKEYLDRNDLDCQLKYYTYEDIQDTGNLYEKLRNEEVDMLLGNDLEAGGEFRMVTSFQAQPYYMVTTVGNTEVLEGLNMALRNILESTPKFAEEAYYSNFPDVRMKDIQLNDEELRYIEERGTVTVAVPADWHPLCCQNNPSEIHKGMIPELLEKMRDFTGLEFELIYGENYTECLSMVLQGNADILGAYLDGDVQAGLKGLVLSQSYIDLNNIIIKHKSTSYPGEGLVCGVMTGRVLPAGFEAEEVRNYNTVQEMMKAVDSGEVDYVYGLSAMLEREIQNHRYLNVMPVTREGDTSSVSFAIARPVVPELLTILNKAVENIPTKEKAVMLNRNLISSAYTGMSVKEIIYANPLACVVALTGVLLLIMTVILLVIRNRMKNTVMQTRLEAAEARSQAKSSFLSQMSHEIRTPMNAIIGLTELTGMEKNIPPEIEKKLKKINSSSQYLLSLINDILDMSRIENGKMEMEEKDFSMSQMLDELQEMMSVQAEQNGLQFRKFCRINHEWLIGDPLRLRQILTNLLSNAIKFTPSGGSVTLRVEELSCDEAGAEYWFSVQDTGVGIRAEEQERIFASFEQLEPSLSNSAGTGLGLPISRSIAQMMGGDLEVKSEPGTGSEFYMTLKFPLGTGEPVKQEQGPARELRELAGMTVLLAEDNDLNAEIAQEFLAMQGIRSRRAANGQEAVDLFKASEPGEYQAILMDIQMPVKNGHEAAGEIRSSGRPDADVPIIAMTANTFKEDQEAARAAGMDGFVPKPVDPARLITVLRQYAKR